MNDAKLFRHRQFVLVTSQYFMNREVLVVTIGTLGATLLLPATGRPQIRDVKFTTNCMAWLLRKRGAA